jgi:hypothetical protein
MEMKTHLKFYSNTTTILSGLMKVKKKNKIKNKKILALIIVHR